MKQQARILYISHERKMGGANLSLFDLVTEMKKRGYSVAVVVLFRGCPIDVALRREGIETFPCFFGWWMQPTYWNIMFKITFRFIHWMQWLSVIRISSYVRRKKFNIIHSNSSVIDIGAQVAVRTGIKHVWHFREFGELHYHFEYMLGKDRTFHYMNNNSDMVIFISRALEQAYPQIHTSLQIYNGLSDEAFFMPERLHQTIQTDSYVFIVSGAITRGKNQKVVLEAVYILNCMLSDLCYNEKYEVWFAGEATALSDSQKYKKELITYVEKKHIPNIKFLGFVNNMRLIRERANAEIVASLNEAYGRVTIEAMAAGNYIIASNSGSNIELIGENERGMLFECNNPYDLALKMKELLTNSQKASMVETRAYEYALTNHRMMNNICRVENVYSKLINITSSRNGYEP